MAEQTKWLDSLEGKTNQLKAAWQELANTILDSDFLKGCIDAGTTLLSVLSKIINTIGGFNTALIATGLTLFIKNFD